MKPAGAFTKLPPWFCIALWMTMGYSMVLSEK